MVNVVYSRVSSVLVNLWVDKTVHTLFYVTVLHILLGSTCAQKTTKIYQNIFKIGTKIPRWKMSMYTTWHCQPRLPVILTDSYACIQNHLYCTTMQWIAFKSIYHYLTWKNITVTYPKIYFQYTCNSITCICICIFAVNM